MNNSKLNMLLTLIMFGGILIFLANDIAGCVYAAFGMVIIAVSALTFETKRKGPVALFLPTTAVFQKIDAKEKAPFCIGLAMIMGPAVGLFGKLLYLEVTLF